MKKIFTMMSLGVCSVVSAQTTFNYTDSVQLYVVPACVDSVIIEAWGASGANATDKLITNSSGGKGGYATGTLGVSPGDTLYVYVGGKGDSINGTGGYNGGGDGGYGNAGSSCFGGFAGGGGGASDVRIGDSTLASRVIVAGGGGGAGRDYCNGTCQPCGCGGTSGGAGGLTGNDGQAAYNCGYGYAGQGINNGKGATQSAGGTGGPGDANGPNGLDGALGLGGNGAGGNYDVAGGGGGGGYYGGGGGGGASSGNGVGGGGAGGGSSYIGGVINGTTIGDTATGHGIVIITPIDGINLTVSVIPGDTVCEGEQVTLTGSGADTYSWDNGITNGVPFAATTTTTYTMVGTDTVESCSDSTTFTLTVLPAPDATIGFTNLGLGYNFTNTEGGGVSWLWDFGDGDTAQTQNPSHTFPAEGQYVVCLTVTDTNGCSSTSCDTIDAAFPTGIWTKNSNDLIKVFPNPATDVLYVTSNQSLANAQVSLYSIEGKAIQVESRLNGNQIEVSLPGLKPGIYSIRVTTEKGVALQRVTIQ